MLFYSNLLQVFYLNLPPVHWQMMHFTLAVSVVVLKFTPGSRYATGWLLLTVMLLNLSHMSRPIAFPSDQKMSSKQSALPLPSGLEQPLQVLPRSLSKSVQHLSPDRSNQAEMIIK